MQIKDPRTIQQEDLPLFVYSDNARDLISFLITWRTKGLWNHVMLEVNAGKFAWQSMSIFNSYRENDMAVYLKTGMRLDIYCLVNNTPEINLAARKYVADRLKSSWWNKSYDFIGILGQAIGLPKIHTPGLEYCSVDVTNCLKSISHLLPDYDQKIINSIPDEVNPQELHDIMVANPMVFKEYGFYESDEGIIV